MKRELSTRLKALNDRDTRSAEELYVSLVGEEFIGELPFGEIPHNLKRALDDLATIEALREEWVASEGLKGNWYEMLLGTRFRSQQIWVNTPAEDSEIVKSITPVERAQLNTALADIPIVLAKTSWASLVLGLWVSLVYVPVREQNLRAEAFLEMLPPDFFYAYLGFALATGFGSVLSFKFLNSKQELQWSFNREAGVCALFNTRRGEYRPHAYAGDLDLLSLEFNADARQILFEEKSLMDRVQVKEVHGERPKLVERTRCTLHEAEHLEELSFALGEIRAELERLFAEAYSADLWNLDTFLRETADVRQGALDEEKKSSAHEEVLRLSGKAVEKRQFFDFLLSRLERDHERVDALAALRGEAGFVERCEAQHEEVANFIRLIRHTIFMLPNELVQREARGAVLQLTDDSLMNSIGVVREFEDLANMGLASVSPKKLSAKKTRLKGE